MRDRVSNFAGRLTDQFFKRLTFWTVDLDVEKILWVALDVPDARVNSLGTAVIIELEKLILRVEEMIARDEIVGLVIASAKNSGFIAGADIREFDDLSHGAELEKALDRVHKIFNQMEALDVPLVAAINGFCLGGGLELALACHYRVAVDDPKVRIGFPEVKLGIFPGFGGTGRAIRQAGAADAMQIMLSGKMLSVRSAKRLNLVDQLVANPDQLRWAARKAVLAKKQAPIAPWTKQVPTWSFVRPLAVKQMKRQLAQKVRVDHFPAPFELIEHFAEYGGDVPALNAHEKDRFMPLMASDTAKQLRRVFFLSEGLKRAGREHKNIPFERVHVIGAGIMGGDIAAWCALRGCVVTLQDISPEQIDAALGRAQKLFAKRLRSAAEIDAARRRLVGDVQGAGLKRAHVVIEAVSEDLKLKSKILSEAEMGASPDAILATNTSSLDPALIAKNMHRPDRLVGLHFFNPVAQLPLVEIIRSKENSDDDMGRAAAFALHIGKSPLEVKSSPGFLVNRVLTPYLLSAAKRVDAGAKPRDLDAAALAFGMPMGPIELLDTVGLDIAQAVAKELGQEVSADSHLLRLLGANKLGRKTGEGFYRWRNGKPAGGAHKMLAGDAQLGKEILSPLVDACEACLADGRVAHADLVDIGVILGTGFAPFLGGPLQARKDGKV